MESNKHCINIAAFTEYPGPRYCNQGDKSGEEFYHNILNSAFADAYNDNSTLTVDLDGTAGYASSFLDEAFGNLAYDFSLEIVKPKLKIISTQEPDWERMILGEILDDWEKRRLNKDEPRKTGEHDSWYRLIDGKLLKKVW